jgi:hypothetical protein
VAICKLLNDRLLQKEMAKDAIATSSENNQKNACERKNENITLLSENPSINPLKLFYYDTD